MADQSPKESVAVQKQFPVTLLRRLEDRKTQLFLSFAELVEEVETLVAVGTITREEGELIMTKALAMLDKRSTR